VHKISFNVTLTWQTQSWQQTVTLNYTAKKLFYTFSFTAFDQEAINFMLKNQIQHLEAWNVSNTLQSSVSTAQ